MKKELKKKEDIFKTEPVAQMINDPAIHQAIAEKAYELYEKEGRHHGQDLEDWLEAERWVLSERKAGAPAQKSLSSILRSKTDR